MDAVQFDHIARRVFAGVSRRRVAAALGGLVLAPALGGASASAKKKAKKKPYCLNGSTVKASGKKAKKLKKQGATPGACCVPTCNGTSCGGADGCGGTCGCNAGSACAAGTCAACTVTCTGTPIACGAALTLALADGGTIIACPGRYAGRFTVSTATTLIGAGSGDDPATSTILDGEKLGRTITVPAPSFTMSGVRVVGGKSSFPGGGLFGDPGTDLRISACAFVGNEGSDAGAISARGKMALRTSLFSGNTASGGGAIQFLLAPGPNVVADCIIETNSAAIGGGLYLFGSPVTVTGTTIRTNTATMQGGGVYLYGGSSLTLDAATSITGNSAGQANGGGGIYSETSGGINTLSQNFAKISGNTPDQCQGVICA
ncbi:MAG: right-handed parallel beta-helix repeat-containing protein [Thermomicrobiales bacterium]